MKAETHFDVNSEGHGYWAVCFDDGSVEILHTGDQLMVYSPEDPNQLVWGGEIHLMLDGEMPYGSWVATRQLGVSVDTWEHYFQVPHPVEFTPHECVAWRADEQAEDYLARCVVCRRPCPDILVEPAPW